MPDSWCCHWVEKLGRRNPNGCAASRRSAWKFRSQTRSPNILQLSGMFSNTGTPLRQRARSCGTPSSSRPRVGPASIALIVQRRAAIQNCCLCPVQQNFCIDPPVARGVKIRPHQRQQVLQATGCGVSSQIAATDPLPPFVVVTNSELIMCPLYESERGLTIFKCLIGSLIHRIS